MNWLAGLRSKDRYFVVRTIERFEGGNLSPQDLLDELDRELDVWKLDVESWEDPLLVRLSGLYAANDKGSDVFNREFVEVLGRLEEGAGEAEGRYRIGRMVEIIGGYSEAKVQGQELLLGLDGELRELQEWDETWGSFAFDVSDQRDWVELELDYLSDGGYLGRRGKDWDGGDRLMRFVEELEGELRGWMAGLGSI